MTASIVFPVLCLSFINHQEPRFLIPVILPIVLLHATKLQFGFCPSNPFQSDNVLTKFVYKTFLTGKSAKTYLKLWYVFNLFLTIFFGFCHQGGVLQLGKYFNKQVLPITSQNVHVHLVTSHLYNLPMSLLFMPNAMRLYTNPETGQKYRKEKNFFLHEYGGLNMTELHKKLKLILDINEFRLKNKNKSKAKKYRIFLALPASLSDELNLAFYNSNSTIMQYRQVRVFYPHLSTEAMPDFSVKHPCEVNTDFFEIDTTCDAAKLSRNEPLSVATILHGISSMVHQFGLVLYKVEINAAVLKLI